MANEIANISHAGIILQVFEAGTVPSDAPKVLGAWGFRVVTLRRATEIGVGRYTIELEAAGSGVVNEAGTDFEKLDQLVMVTPVFADGEVTAGLISLTTPFVPGKAANLETLLIAINDGGAPSDEAGFVNVEVRRIPEQS